MPHPSIPPENERAIAAGPPPGPGAGKNLQSQSGMVMLIAVLLLACALGAGVTMLNSANTGVQIAGNGRKALSADLLAQSGIEYGMQRVSHDLLHRNPLDTSFFALDTQIHYGNHDIHVYMERPTNEDVFVPIQSGPYSGLQGKLNTYSIFARTQYENKFEAKGEDHLEYWHIPLFQLGYIFEATPQDTMVYLRPGFDMVLGGRIHFNGNAEISSIYGIRFDFEDRITSSGNLLIQPVRGSSGDPVIRVFDNIAMRDLYRYPGTRYSWELPNWKQQALGDFNGNVMDQAHGVEPLRLPVPAGQDNFVVLEPKRSTDNAFLRGIKLAYQCDRVLKVNFDHTGLIYTVNMEDRDGNAAAVDASIFSNFKFFSMWELDEVAMLTVDVKKMTDLGQLPPNGALYVEVQIANSKKQAGVFLHNGHVLAQPLSVITNGILAVRGNYNNGDTNNIYDSLSSAYAPKPAALMGRSIYQFTRYFNPATQIAPAYFNAVADPDDINEFTVWKPDNNFPTAKNMRRWNLGYGSGKGFGPGGKYIQEVRACFFTGRYEGIRYQENLTHANGLGASANRYTVKRVGSIVSILEDKTHQQYPRGLYNKGNLWPAYGNCACDMPYNGDFSPGYQPPHEEFAFDPKLRTPSGLPPATPYAVMLQRASWTNPDRLARE